jgi:hypothetical protein
VRVGNERSGLVKRKKPGITPRLFFHNRILLLHHQQRFTDAQTGQFAAFHHTLLNVPEQ